MNSECVRFVISKHSKQDTVYVRFNAVPINACIVSVLGIHHYVGHEHQLTVLFWCMCLYVMHLCMGLWYHICCIDQLSAIPNFRIQDAPF